MALWTLPKIEYPATHTFENELFTKLTYAGALFCLTALVIFNVAVVGYEPTVILSSNFNDTQKFWFHKVSNPPEPGTLCDPHVLNVGDSLVTNASIFEWKIIGITQPSAGQSGVAYNGSVLNHCDVVQMHFYGDIRTRTMDITAYTACRKEENFEVVTETKMSFSPLPARRGPFMRNVQFSPTKPASINLMDMVESLAAEDVRLRAWVAFPRTDQRGTVAFSLSVNTEFCPPLVGLKGHLPSPCALQTPQLNFTKTVAVGENLEPYELDETLRPPITNLLHLALAAMRVDLGNPSPNNFLTHPEMLNRTLIEVFPQTPSASSTPSKLYAHLYQQSLVVGSGSASVFDPFGIPGPSVVQAVYVCKFLKRKGTVSLIVSVFVATAGFFTTGWGVFITVATCLKGARYGKPGKNPATGVGVGLQSTGEGTASTNSEENGATPSPASTRVSSVTYIDIV